MEHLENVAQFVDIAIYIVTAIAAITAYRRGFLKELLIALAYIPYIAILFYFINNFAQNRLSFDAMILKLSAVGGFYLAYLFTVYIITKLITNKFKHFIPSSLIVTGNITALFISIFRTIYFLLICLIFYHLHFYTPEYLEKSKVAMRIYPHAVKFSNMLMSNGILDNEIVLYETSTPEGTYSELYSNPILRKIQSSKKYKEYQESGIEDVIKKKVMEYSKN